MDEDAIAEWEREFRRRRGLSDDDPVPVSLPKMLLPADQARNAELSRSTDEEREPRKADEDITGGEGQDFMRGGAGDDRLLPADDPAAPWNQGIAQPQHVSPKLSYDAAITSEVQPSPRIEADLSGLYGGAIADGVTYPLRTWPVPGEGKAARRGIVGPNGHAYADGRYGPNGEFRIGRDKKPRPHMGIDLPAKIGSAVVAADSGTVVEVDAERYRKGALKGQKKGYGDYVTVEYGDGTRGRYAHLNPEGRPAKGKQIERGQTIGTVGNTGNAKDYGDHVHYEVRTSTGRTIDPTVWMRQKRRYVYRPE